MCKRIRLFPCIIILINYAYGTKTTTFNEVAPSSIISTIPNKLGSHHLEPINGTTNYRVYGSRKVKEDKHWLDGRGLGIEHMKCVRRASCEKLNFSTCLGAKLPYEYTSLDLTISPSQHDLQERLNKYLALKHIPRCWAVIQPFLCAVLVPKCGKINGEDMVYLPSLEMCRITLEPCRILYNTGYFPEFLQCNESYYPSKCGNDVREMKFNLTAECLEPLVAAESSVSYHPAVEGCGVRCKDPLYTDDEHRQIQKLVAWGSGLCLLANLFVVTTFLIDWENASKYPALIVFYINVCFLIACLGWLVQFTPGSHEDIVCRKDGTLRHSEPTAGQNLSCVVIFVIIYYFLIAAMVWFVFLTYAWHLRAVGNFQDRIDKKGSYFHLIAWSLPLVLTITTLALSEVDGNSTVGICFVGYMNHPIRAGLVLGPLLGVILVGGYFIIRGMVLLFGLKRFANVIKSTMASNKIHTIIVRMSWCAMFTLIFILGAVVCHVYEFMGSAHWSQSLTQYIICRIFSPFNEHMTCKIENRPSVSILQCHLLCFFGAGIAMSSWCWTSSSLETWKRYVRKKYGGDLLEEVKMPKHKVIAQTWAKRKEFEDKGRLSITLCNTHTDPVGLNFDVYDINSSETVEISSTWANYLPKCVKRRMALTLATNSSSQGPRKSSIDSEISFSVRHVSVESRRNSVDSQVSVKIAEMKTKVAARTSTRHGRRNNKRSNSLEKRGHKRKDFISAAEYKRNRRESSTSIESQIIALKKTTYPQGQNSAIFTKSSKQQKQNSKRRSADPTDIAKFLAKNGELILPFLKNQPLSSSSDTETSQSTFNLENCRLNMALKSNNASQNSIEGIPIEEIFNTGTKMKNNQPSKSTNCGNKIKVAMSDDSLNHKASRNSNKQSRKSAETNSSSRIMGRKRPTKRQRHNSSSSNNYKYMLKPRIDDEALLKASDLDLDLDLDVQRHLSCAVKKEILTYEMDMPRDSIFNTSMQMSARKTNSRNSKISCDVGIQTLNAYELSNNTTEESENEEEQNKMQKHSSSKICENSSERMKSEEKEANEKEYNESSSLLQNKPFMVLSEAEKLKILLLPSK